MTALRIIGKFLISVGMGILIFVGWTLWGTGFYYSDQQDSLRTEFTEQSAASAAEDPGEIRGAPEGFAPKPGKPVFNLIIPAIDLDEIVVEGVGVEDLRKGPGHYPECRSGFTKPLCTEWQEVWPGERGRVIVSGHRTTYGAPFWDLDKIRKGDEIITRTKWGRYTYVVTDKDLVKPDSLAIAVPSDHAEIVLTTCNPKFSAAQRLVIFAQLAATQ
jgi:sortase A